MERFKAALALAVDYHAGQTRKGTGIPYIAHVLSVAALVLEHGGEEDVAVAALLHDALEDAAGAAEAEGRRREIGERFGARALRVVERCTDADAAERTKLSWIERKRRYVTHLRDEHDADVLLVTTADKLHNVRTILTDYRREGEPLWDRFNGRREGTLWYYRAVTEALRVRAPERLVVELDRAFAELEALAGQAWSGWEG